MIPRQEAATATALALITSLPKAIKPDWTLCGTSIQSVAAASLDVETVVPGRDLGLESWELYNKEVVAGSGGDGGRIGGIGALLLIRCWA